MKLEQRLAVWSTALQGFGLRATGTQVSSGSVSAAEASADPVSIRVPDGTCLVVAHFEHGEHVLLLPAQAAGDGDEATVVRNVGGSALGRIVLRPFINQPTEVQIDQWEAQARPERARFYRQTDARSGAAAHLIGSLDWNQVSSGRSLLLLHDQFSQTQRTFAGLDDDLLGELSNRYRGRVWAYDHPTLTMSPRDNAQRLHRLLADTGVKHWDIDILAVGRGGLVARHFTQMAPANVDVGTMMFVGTPNFGTPLADPARLVAYVNRVFNLMADDDDPVADIADICVRLLSANLAQLAVPGITAMDIVAALAQDAFGRWNGRLVCVGSDVVRQRVTLQDQAVVDWPFDTVFDGQPNDMFVGLASSQPSSLGAITPECPSIPGIRHGRYMRSPAVWTAIRSAFAELTATTREVVAADTARRVTVASAQPDVKVTGRGTPLSVTVRHGSIEHVRIPVIVGHLQGTPLSGPEERLDLLCDGELSARRALRRYAGVIGEVVLVKNIASIPTTAIVGLGPTGELTATKLTQALIPAFIDLARDHMDEWKRAALARRSSGSVDDSDGPPPLSVALVPIGTSYASGMTVESSVRAVLAAVEEAELGLNATLRGHVDSFGTAAASGGTEFYFAGIQFVERYQDKLEILVSVLDRLDREALDQGSETAIQSTPQAGEGSAPGWPPSDREEVWRRLFVHVADDDTAQGMIEYTVTGRLAKAEVIAKPFDRSVIDPMLRQAIVEADDDAFPRALYELLVPNELKGEMATGENLHLLVDATSAYIPWELLTPRPVGYQASVPLALRGGVLRQFKESERSWSQPTRSSELRALVIGNPPCERSRFPNLPGAAQEAASVAQILLASKWNVEQRIWREHLDAGSDAGAEVEAAGLNSLLVTGDWRVVHIAAHGVIGENGQSGIVLGANQLITPGVFGSLSIVPDLVFINACHLGTIGPSVTHPRRALAGMNVVSASVARSLMQLGVRAVVVAGWAVNDVAAQVFAEALYRSMLEESADFGSAVDKARIAARTEVPSSQTWGAYQCYGDAGFRLLGTRPKKLRERSGAKDRYRVLAADRLDYHRRGRTGPQRSRNTNRAHLRTRCTVRSALPHATRRPRGTTAAFRRGAGSGGRSIRGAQGVGQRDRDL